MPSRRSQTTWRSRPPGRILECPNGVLLTADALGCLRSLKESSADIVFLDPPFNLGKKYGGHAPQRDRLTDRQYFRQMCLVLDEATYILKEGGALYLYHLPRWAYRFASVLQKRLTFRHWIAISMKNGFARGDALYPAHYALLYFTKGKPAVFKRPKLPIQRCRHCGKPVKDYGGYAEFVADGVNLGDIWDDLSPVRHKKHKNRRANELPVALTSRIVSISGRHGGLLVDPYCGTGSSLVAATTHGMRFVGCDLDREQLQMVRTRVRRTLKERKERRTR